MKNAVAAVNELKGLNLSSYPRERIYNIITELGQIGSIRVDFPVGKSIIRARPNEPGKVFSMRSELCYKPAQFNTT